MAWISSVRALLAAGICAGALPIHLTAATPDPLSCAEDLSVRYYAGTFIFEGPQRVVVTADFDSDRKAAAATYVGPKPPQPKPATL